MSDEDLRLNPYVGLRPFFVEDSLYFYGREQQTTELLAILREHRFLAVVGSSGSGKSSLVRAGLLPGLIGGFLVRDRDRWSSVQIKPGDAPMANLAAGLIKAMKRPAEEAVALEQSLRADRADAAVEFLRAHLDDRTNAFILVDQFEEIFAFRGADDDGGTEGIDATRRKERARRRAEAAEFVDLLLRLSERRDLPVYVTITMRTDFLGECDLFYGLPEAFNRGRYLVPRLTREQLRDAVECPALLLGATVAPRLLDQVLNALGDRIDRLPVLQHALLRTWDVWDQAGRIGPLDVSHYWKAGGLEGALDQDAEGALKNLDRDAVARVFKRLTDTDANQRRVRSPARISELAAASGLADTTVRSIIEEFEKNGRSFVHPSADGKAADPRVDISHESLIRQWNSLRTWVDEERASRDIYRELVTRAGRQKDEKAALLPEPELGITYSWRKKEKPSAGWAGRYSRNEDDFTAANDYLDESVRTRSRELAELELDRHWRRRWAPAIALIVLSLVAWFAPEGFRSLLTPEQADATKAAPATVRVRELIWTTDDREQALDWRNANQRCNTLDLPLEPGGPPFTEWRLPYTSELADLYSPDDADGFGRKLKKAFHGGVHADYLWSQEPAQGVSGHASRFAADFKNQLIVSLPADTAGIATALCVTFATNLLTAEGKAAAVGDADLRTRAEAGLKRSSGYWNSLLGAVMYGGALLLLYSLLAVIGRRLQRRFTLKTTVRRFEQAGGRLPVAAAPDPGPREEAVIVHHTVYAMTFRRMAGWAIDQALFAAVMSFIFGVMMFWLEPQITVTMPDGNAVHGTLVEWRAGEVEFKNDAGETVIQPLLRQSLPSFVKIGSGDPETTTLPTGTATKGWAFLKQVVQVPLDTGENWYGTLDVAHADENTVALNYTIDQYRKTRDEFFADLRWRFGADGARVNQEAVKWTAANPPPVDAVGQRTFPSRTAEVTEIIYPPTSAEWVIFMLVMLFVAWHLEARALTSKHQATIGMRIVGIMRTGLYGERLSLRQATIMWLYRLGSYLAFGLGFAVQPFTKRWQTVHDRLSSTVVVRRPKPGKEFTPPSRRHRWIVVGVLAGAPLVFLLLAVASTPGLGDVGVEAGLPGEEPFVARWDTLGLGIEVSELALNGEPVHIGDPGQDPDGVSFVVEVGAPIQMSMVSSLMITPPPRCLDADCPVGFLYGWDSIDDPSAIATSTSSCGEPAALVSGQGRTAEFNRELSLVAPTTPGRYQMWIHFPKLAECRAASTVGDFKSHLLNFQVEPVWP